MANRFRLWFSRNGGKAIITIILIIVFCKLVDRANEYYANKNNGSSNRTVIFTNTEDSNNITDNISDSNITTNSSNSTNVVNETNIINSID